MQSRLLLAEPPLLSSVKSSLGEEEVDKEEERRLVEEERRLVEAEVVEAEVEEGVEEVEEPNVLFKDSRFLQLF